MSINLKFFRLDSWLNKWPRWQGSVGLTYDSYRNLKPKGPVTINIALYFFGIDLEFGRSIASVMDELYGTKTDVNDAL